MKIHQFTLQFHPEQDRLVFRMNTVEKEEFRFYFTRRFVKLLWPVLLQMMEDDYKSRRPETVSPMTGAILEFEHEKVISQADFKQRYAEDTEKYPLGKDPVLLGQIRVKKIGNASVLCLLPSQGQGVEFHAGSGFLHTFCKLLHDTVAKADWDMRLHLPGEIPQGVKPKAGQARVLH